MAKICLDNKKFSTAEASTKSAMRTEKAINEFLDIINLRKFRALNNMWSRLADEKHGVKGKLFLEDQVGDKLKAVPNKPMFKAIDRARGIFYQASGYSNREIDSIFKANPQLAHIAEHTVDEVSYIDGYFTTYGMYYRGKAPIDGNYGGIVITEQEYNKQKLIQSKNLFLQNEGNYQFQLEDYIEASPETLNKVKEVIQKMGVNLQSLSEYVKTNPDVESKGVNALTDLTRGIIAIAEGKEGVALTEEMVHVATSMIEQVNPKMITEMISRIGTFQIYNEVFEQYKNVYKTADGKPDIRRIKKEAVDKLIAQIIIDEGNNDYTQVTNEASKSEVRTWWQRILDYIRSLYKNTNTDIFQQAAQQIMEGDMSVFSSDYFQDGVYYQLSDVQKTLQQKILDTQKTVKKVESNEKVDPILQDTEEASNWYEIQNAAGAWVRIKKRVTDRVKAWYKQRFPGKIFTEQEKKFNELKRETGVKGHKFIEEIHARFFNEDGTAREKVLNRPDIKDNVDFEIYLKLEKYFIELIERFKEDGQSPLVMSEVVVYDNIEKEAGTIDLLIIDGDGTTHILDWKFMSVAKESQDIPWYKQGAFDIQLGRYKDILIKRYGVKKIGYNRAIPILLNMQPKDKNNPKSEMMVKGISIGSVDTTQIEDFNLMPVPERTETTGNENLDILISKLNAMLTQIGKIKARSDTEREYKRERLNVLKKTIRQLRVTFELDPLIDTIRVMRREGQMIIDDWNARFKDNPASDKNLTHKVISDFADNLLEYQAVATALAESESLIGDLIYNPKEDKLIETLEEQEEIEQRKKILEDVKEESDLIKNSLKDIIKISREFADKFTGIRNLVAGLLDPEAIVKGLGSVFEGVSELPLASLQIMYKLISTSRNRATEAAMEKVDRMLAIRKRIEERGGNIRDIISQVYQKDDKGKNINKLVYRYSKEFYDGVDANAEEGKRSKEWINQNVDVAAYTEEALAMMNSKIERNNSIYEGNPTLRDEMNLQEARKWDIRRNDFIGYNNYILKRHPLQKWESAEYKKIKQDKDVLDLYNFIHDINDDAADIGYISNAVHNTFLPFVRKSFAERLTWDMNISGIMKFADNLKARADDVGYGKVNELTSEYEYAIPKYYTTDFTVTDDGGRDYSEVSEDLFKNMILYISHLEKYKHMSDIEGQLLLIRSIETFKNHLATTKTGNLALKDGRPEELVGNDENARMFEVFLRAMLYEHKYPLTDSDANLGLGQTFKFLKAGINKLLGKEVEDVEKPTTALSMMKSIDFVNRAMQMKTLGLEIISGAANAFGGTIQAITQAGNYFRSSELISSATTLLENQFTNETEREAFLQLMDTFMPLKEDPLYDRVKKAGLSVSTRIHMSDWIMIFMRLPELYIEKSIFMSLLKNTMVVNGKMVNIREYVKEKHQDRYASPGRYKQLAKRMEDEINELKKSSSIYSTKKIENGKLVVPGLDLSDRDEIQRLTTLTRRLSRNATGGISDADFNQASLNIWTKSMMVFKGWIPKLVKTRFGEFRKVADDFSVKIDENGITTGEKYDIGRARLWFYVMGTSIRDLSMNINNVIQMNEKGILMIDELYDKYATQYEKNTGKVLAMTKEAFTDMVRTNLINQTRELALLLALIGLHFSMGLVGPDDPDDKATRNFYRFAQRTVDKFVQELSFFYNPVEFHGLLSGSMFPAMGLISDVMKFTDHLIMETTGLDISNPSLSYEEVVAKAHPLKYGAKIFPGTKAGLTYGSIISNDFAEFFDITISNRTRR